MGLRARIKAALKSGSRVAVFSHAHYSGNYRSSAGGVRDDIAHLRGKGGDGNIPRVSVITATEVSHDGRADAIGSGLDWSSYYDRGNTIADCAIGLDLAVWLPFYHETSPVGEEFYYRAGSGRKVYVTVEFVVTEFIETGQIGVWSVGHPPVQNTPQRIKVTDKAAKPWKQRLNELQREYNADFKVAVMDGNRSLALWSTKQWIRQGFGMAATWLERKLPKRGTLRGKVIDYALVSARVKVLGGPWLISQREQHVDHTDHVSWWEVLSVRGMSGRHRKALRAETG